LLRSTVCHHVRDRVRARTRAEGVQAVEGVLSPVPGRREGVTALRVPAVDVAAVPNAPLRTVTVLCFLCTHTYTHACPHAHPHTHTRAHTHTHTHTHAHTNTHTHARIHTDTQLRKLTQHCDTPF